MYNPAKRNIYLGDLEGKRFKKLGDYGELLAHQLLEEHAFENIIDLNEIKKNAPFADFFAIRDGSEYIISVKTRNKFENTGKLNSRYKLGSSNLLLEKFLATPEFEPYCSATPAWLAISMEENTFDAYWGILSDLPGNQRGIPMSKSAKQTYTCLALNKVHPFKGEDFQNVYKNQQ